MKRNRNNSPAFTTLKKGLRTVVVLLTITLFASTAVTAQRITLKEKNVSLSKVFNEIKRQSGYLFFYENSLLENTHTITIHVTGVSLQQALDECLKDFPLAYTIVEKTIVIKKKENIPEEENSNDIEDNTFDVPGVITDSTNQGLPNAYISFKLIKRMVPAPNSEIDVVTYTTPADKSGKFRISGLLPGKYLVNVTYVGFSDFSREITLNKNSLPLIISMQAVYSQLDQVRVIAYGTESRRLAVGAVNTVSSKDIETQPVTNPLLALEGLVPGLNITPTSGAPGAGVTVQIRGKNTLSSSPYNFGHADQPLFIVDGVPTAAQNFNINTLNSLGNSNSVSDGVTGISPFNNLNPGDIESVSVLKDAAATSIYGTQGANGVIIITTKKGKAGKNSFDASVNNGINIITRPLEMLNLQQYLALRREAIANDGVDLSTAAPTDYPDLLLFDQNKSTDWFHFYEGKVSNKTDAHISVTGGSDKTTFIVSGGYTREDYNFPGDYADNRLSLHSNIHHASASNRFTIDFGFDYTYDKNNSSGQPSFTAGILTPPNYPDLLTPSGDLVWNYKGFNLERFQLLAYLKQTSLLQAYNMLTSLHLGYRLASHVTLTINAGYSRLNAIESQRYPAKTGNPADNPSSFSDFSNGTFQTLNIEPQITYDQTFGKNQFTILAGGTYKKNLNDELRVSGFNYSDDALLGSISAAGSVLASDSRNPYKYVSGFARLGYIYDRKYIIQVSGRRDGSSNFGPDKRFGNFGAVGLGWIFSDEKGFKKALPFFSFGKLSGSYGTTGSDNTKPYGYQTFFQGYSGSSTFQGTRPLLVQNLFNKDYSWDEKRSLNIGLDLGFADDRFLLNANFYQDRIGNQLVNYTLPSQTGFSTVIQNLNALLQNRGLEFSFTSKNIDHKHFGWTTSFNISGNRNKLLKFPELDVSPYANIYDVGKSVNIVKGYVYKGVNPATGIFEYYKADGTVTSYPSYGIPSQGGDNQYIADLEPKFTGGLANTIAYKQLSLYVNFQFQDKTGRNYLYSIYNSNSPGGFNNMPTVVLEHWKKPGDTSPLQKPSAGFSDVYTAGYYLPSSSGAYSDASYIRLKTVAISYNLPSSFLKKIKATNTKLYLNAQNLLLITGYKVGDPELGNLFTFPLQRTFVFGISANF